jgi:outer membrane protein assembly complex protein YaeT
MHATDRSCWPTLRWAGVVAGALLFGLAASAQTQTPTQAQAPAAERTIVSDVLIQGNRLVPTEQIKGWLKTRAGKEYVPEVTQEDVRTLYATKQFGNVYAKTEDDGPNKVRVIFYIRDYANVVEKVTYQGAKHISTEDLNTLTAIRTGLPLNPMANRAACAAIVRRLNEDGHPFASCTLLKGADMSDTEVVFNITEGPKVKVGGIQFTGNTFVSGEVLRTHVNISTGPFRLCVFATPYNTAMIDNDVAELTRYYRNFGFHDVRIARELRWSPDGRHVIVIFHINEGVRYRVKDPPRVEGVKSVAAEQLEVLSKVKANDFYDQRTIDGDVARIKNFIGMTGREAKAEVQQIYSPDNPGIVTVNYEVQDSPPARVGQIYIIGNERTRDNVILRQIPLYPGQILTYPDLLIAERNLKRLNIFEVSPDGAVRPTLFVREDPRDPNNPVKDIEVRVQEASTGSLLFGVGVNSDSGLTGSIVLNERNFDLFNPPTSLDDFLEGRAFRGAGQEFRAEAVPGTQIQRYSVTFREPFLFDSPYSLTTSAYYYERFYNEYTEQRVGGRLTLGRKLNEFWSVNASLRVEDVNVSNVNQFIAPPDFRNVQGDNLLVGGRLGVTRDTRDNFMRPTSGSLLDVSYEQVTGDQNYPLVNVDFAKYFTVFQRADGSGKQVLAFHSQVGWAGTTTPVFERFYAGGFRSLRGFEFRGVGPEVNGYKTGGDFLFLNSLEYQIPVRANDQIYFVGFIDSGTVEPRINNISDYRVSAGFGVRFVVPMLGPVPIALDFGFPIVKGPQDNQQIFNFWMGFFR